MTKIIVLELFIMFLALVMMPSESAIQKQYTVYLHVISGGPNANLVGSPGQHNTFTDFGAEFMFDAPVTDYADNIDSSPVGRAKGTLAICSFNGTEVCLTFSIVVRYGEFSGSTAEFQGVVEAAPSPAFNGKLSLLSGTKSLQFVRGYAEIFPVLQNPPTYYTVNKLTVVVEFDRL